MKGSDGVCVCQWVEGDKGSQSGWERVGRKINNFV